MTLYETGESNGAISLHDLFDENYDCTGKLSTITLEDLFFAACRGGWPRGLSLKSRESQLEIARDYFRQIYQKDISAIDGVKRNPEWAKTILWSYAKKMAALGLSPEYFNNDLDTFGHVFENLVIRDLLVFAQAHDARVLHYSDNLGLEADVVYQLNDGRYALIEIKTGENAVESAEKSLLKFRDLIRKHNAKQLENQSHPGVMYREPSLLMIICGNAPMSYITANGVTVIPIGCLKD